MNVLSLFDGMSCGQIALSRLGKKVDKYFASEVDKHAIATTLKNFPDTVQLGSVTGIDPKSLPAIDLMIGGSPCQSFTFAGKRKGMSTKCKVDILTLEQYLEMKQSNFEFEGESYLFWEYVRLLRELKPKYFLLENVMMKREWRDQISEALGVEPVMIDSKLVSAQNRKRLYWTNIPLRGTIEDRGLTLEDIVEQNFDQKYWLPQKNADILSRKVDITGAPSLCAIDVYNKRYKTDGRCPTLTHPCHNTIRLLQDGRFRKLTPLEYERLQNVPEGYTAGHSDTTRGGFMANGWTVDVITYIFEQMQNDMKKVAHREMSVE